MKLKGDERYILRGTTLRKRQLDGKPDMLGIVLEVIESKKDYYLVYDPGVDDSQPSSVYVVFKEFVTEEK